MPSRKETHCNERNSQTAKKAPGLYLRVEFWLPFHIATVSEQISHLDYLDGPHH